MALFGSFLTIFTAGEHVQTIELVKSPEECKWRLSEGAEVIAGPIVVPYYKSIQDYKDEYARRKSEEDGLKTISQNVNGEKKSRQVQPKLNVCATGSHMSEENQVDIRNLASGCRNDRDMLRSGLETSANALRAESIENKKLWHYRDPHGKSQGPFSMLQLRKWNKTGLFPPDMRIWITSKQDDSVLLTDALNGKFHGSLELDKFFAVSRKCSGIPSDKQLKSDAGGDADTNQTGTDKKLAEAVPHCNSTSLLSINTECLRADEFASSSIPLCLDLLKESNSNAEKVSLHPSGPLDIAPMDQNLESGDFNLGLFGEDKNSSEQIDKQMTSKHDPQNKSNNQSLVHRHSEEENLRSLSINLNFSVMDSGSELSSAINSSDEQNQKKDALEKSPTRMPSNKESEAGTVCKLPSISSDFPMQNPDNLKVPCPTPKPSIEDERGQTSESFPSLNSDTCLSSASNLVASGGHLPQRADEWQGYSQVPPKPSVQEWDFGLVSASSLKPPEVVDDVATAGSNSNQLNHSFCIEFDAASEESVSDLLAKVDAMESQGGGGLDSPTSAMKFDKELILDFKDDCFSSIEDFNPNLGPGKSDALSSTRAIRLTNEPSVECKPAVASRHDALDLFGKSDTHQSTSSERETSAQIGRPCAANNMIQEIVATTMSLGTGSETVDLGWGTVQGNINMVTVQGNVNLVLGGPAQGITDLGWGTDPRPSWGTPNINRSGPIANLPWDSPRKYSGEKFSGHRDWGLQGGDPGSGRGRPPWGRQPYGGGGGGGGGYAGSPLKAQRVCKFYENGHCKKGAFCDYLHP